MKALLAAFLGGTVRCVRSLLGVFFIASDREFLFELHCSSDASSE